MHREEELMSSRVDRVPVFTLVISCLLGLAVFSSALAQAEADKELAAKIDRLIRELADDSFAVREKAEQELAQIGEAALAKLQIAANDSSAERSQRATKLLKEIRRAGVGLRHLETVQHPALMGAVTLTLSPDGQFVYVPAFQTSAVSVFGRDALTGLLKHQQTLADPAQLGGVVTFKLSHDGNLAVAAAFSSKTVALLSRNAKTGELTLESVAGNNPAIGLTMVWPIDAIFSTDGKFVYAVDDQAAIVVVFAVEGGKRLRYVESFAGDDRCFDGARGLVAHPDGKTIYVSSRRPGTLSVLDRDPATGKLAVRQVIRDEAEGVHGLAGSTEPRVSRDGKFVYTLAGRFEGDNAVSVFQVGDDGKLKLVQELRGENGGFDELTGPNDIGLAPDEATLYVSGTTSCSLAAFRRDAASGKLTYLATLRSEATGLGADLGANGIDCSSDGRFLYLALENNSAISVFERTAAVKP
jgi:6-phosphogluconolactonase (cycloisomerase 2 family)